MVSCLFTLENNMVSKECGLIVIYSIQYKGGLQSMNVWCLHMAKTFYEDFQHCYNLCVKKKPFSLYNI